MILLLSSFGSSPEQDQALDRLLGKAPGDIQVAYIENAFDVYDDEEALIAGREVLRGKGYAVELVDLRQWWGKPAGLREKLASKDMFLLTGGNAFYLRWLMKATGADEIIIDLVKQGKVYAAASAAAVIAGPTLRHFDELDDPAEAKELIWDGLGLVDFVVIPHVDNEDFGQACRAAGEALQKEGYPIQWLTDAQALLVNGEERWLL